MVEREKMSEGYGVGVVSCVKVVTRVRLCFPTVEVVEDEEVAELVVGANEFLREVGPVGAEEACVEVVPKVGV